jgi:D-tyrosyl-tRNA(Tyr) deacylase
MRIVIHRVDRAVACEQDAVVAQIGRGLVLLVGCAATDDRAVVSRLAGKAARLRVFETSSSLFGQSAIDVGAEVLTVSQFTLMADTTRGSKPSFSRGAETERARGLYAQLGHELEAAGVVNVVQAPFATRLHLHIDHWGPFTIVLDSG